VAFCNQTKKKSEIVEAKANAPTLNCFAPRLTAYPGMFCLFAGTQIFLYEKLPLPPSSCLDQNMGNRPDYLPGFANNFGR
jgi:hypothetical protein